MTPIGKVLRVCIVHKNVVTYIDVVSAVYRKVCYYTYRKSVLLKEHLKLRKTVVTITYVTLKLKIHKYVKP